MEQEGPLVELEGLGDPLVELKGSLVELRDPLVGPLGGLEDPLVELEGPLVPSE